MTIKRPDAPLTVIDRSRVLASSLALLVYGITTGLLVYGPHAAAGSYEVKAPVVASKPIFDPSCAGAERSLRVPEASAQAVYVTDLARDIAATAFLPAPEAAVPVVCQQATGYDVTYEWRGRKYHKVTANPPGAFVRVKIEID